MQLKNQNVRACIINISAMRDWDAHKEMLQLELKNVTILHVSEGLHGMLGLPDVARRPPRDTLAGLSSTLPMPGEWSFGA